MRSLAVLPFKSLTENTAENYIGLGVADSIIVGISRARALAVRPTSAVRAYATRSTDALTAGRELGVDAVLDGTWYREGERLRVAVNLLRVSDGLSRRHLVPSLTASPCRSSIAKDPRTCCAESPDSATNSSTGSRTP